MYLSYSAFIFSPILFLESINIKIIMVLLNYFVSVYFVDTWHAFEYLDYKFKYYLYFIISILQYYIL